MRFFRLFTLGQLLSAAALRVLARAGVGVLSYITAPSSCQVQLEVMDRVEGVQSF